MRSILPAIAIALLAAACASSGGSGSRGAPEAVANADPAAVTPEYVASLPPRQAKAAVDLLVDRYLALAIGRCPVRTDACLNEQFEKSFDQTGDLAPLCAVNGQGSEYQLCLMTAPETVPMVTAIGGDPATDLDWSDLDSTNNAARKQFAEFIIYKKCGSDRRCLVDQAATLLGLSPAVAESCRTHGALSNQLDCISDAKSAEVYQRAIATLS